MILIPKPAPRDNATLVGAATLALRQGLEVAAGVIARTALESHLRSLCLTHDCEPSRKYPTSTDYLKRLYDKRHVTKSTHRELKRAIKVGNECAHGELTTWHEVEWLVGVVQIFMMAYPLPSWFEGVAAAG